MDKQAIKEAAGWRDEVEEEEFAETEHPDLLDANDLIRPEEVKSDRAFWEKPWPRAVLVAIPVGLVLFLITRIVGGNRPAAHQATNLPGDNPTSTTPGPRGETADELKTQLAIQQQQEAFERLKAQKLAQAQLAQAQAQASKRQPQPTPTPTPIAIRPEPVPPRPLPPPISRVPVSSNEPRTIERVVREPAPAPLQVPTPTPTQKAVAPFNPPAPIPMPTPTPLPTPTPTPTPIDPNLAWKQASALGEYGTTAPSGSLVSNSSDQSVPAGSNQGISGGIGIPPQPVQAETPTVAQSQQPSLQERAAPTPFINTVPVSGNVTVGTRTKGTLETAIALSGGSLLNPNQNFLIKLSDPLKASDGSVVLPAGSYLVAHVNGANGNTVNMNATLALVNDTNGQQIQKPLPDGAVMILGEDGKPLQASIHRPSDFLNDIGTALLGGAGQLSAVINQPSTEISTGIDGATTTQTTTTTNPTPNLLAGFGQGAATTLLEQIKTRQQQSAQEKDSQTPIAFLNQGESVQIFVNQSFSL